MEGDEERVKSNQSTFSYGWYMMWCCHKNLSVSIFDTGWFKVYFEQPNHNHPQYFLLYDISLTFGL